MATEVENLAGSDELVRLLMSSTGEGIYGVDLKGNCTFANPACMNILGYKNDSELLGRNMHELVHHTRSDGKPYPVEECRIYQAFREHRGTHVDDEVMFCSDGKPFPAEYWSYPVERNGELVGCVVTFIDIRARREAEQALADRSREVSELARFPEMNPGPVCRLDREGTIVLANASARRLFSDESLVGKCWLDICPQMSKSHWEEVLTSNSHQTHETELGDRYVVFTHTPGEGEHEIFVYGADITERRRAEKTLSKQSQELAELARFPEMNPGPVCRLDRQGTIVLANAAARRLFCDESLVGKCWLDVCPKMTETRWEEVLTSSSHQTHETELGDRYVLFTHTPGEGEHEIFVYGADLTDLRIAERALLQSKKMATLGTLAAGVAHELNNPGAAAQRASVQLGEVFTRLQEAQLALGNIRFDNKTRETIEELDQKAREGARNPMSINALDRSDRETEVETWLEGHGIEDSWEIAPSLVTLGYEPVNLDDLAGHFGDSVAPVVTWFSRTYSVYSLLEEIRHGTSRLAEIVTALKAYSYVGQGPVHSVDINEGLRNTLIILRNKLKRGIAVEQDFAQDLSHIHGYGSELNQVWTNLIDNAAFALKGKGRIRLRTYEDDDKVIVEVENNGPPIPESIQSRVFDPFFTTKAPGEGTGLGLNTSYNIVVQKHGGTIDLESKPGRTRFTIKLPVASAGNEKKGSVDNLSK
jgi:PAS domain S-box-containing protein